MDSRSASVPMGQTDLSARASSAAKSAGRPWSSEAVHPVVHVEVEVVQADVRPDLAVGVFLDEIGLLPRRVKPPLFEADGKIRLLVDEQQGLVELAGARRQTGRPGDLAFELAQRRGREVFALR